MLQGVETGYVRQVRQHFLRPARNHDSRIPHFLALNPDLPPKRIKDLVPSGPSFLQPLVALFLEPSGNLW